MNFFCTYCDQGYAARLVCLHDSLVAQGEPFRLYVLCFDAQTDAVVAAIRSPSFVPVSLDTLLSFDPAYAAVRTKRSKVEFYFTATPVFLRYCLQREPAAQRMTYLDSDLFFFAPPSGVFEMQGDASIGIVPHRFPPRLAHLVNHGRYNVAWVSFRRDVAGMACLEWWRERCLEWCHDYIDQGRYADQGYLDEFPQRFGNVRVLEHHGINAAPWNMDDAQVTKVGGQVVVNNQRLLFYHFQGIRELLPGWFESGLSNYQTELTRTLCDFVYLPYLGKLAATQRALQEKHGLRPQLGYQRVPAGKTRFERWRNAVFFRLSPHLRRWRGELIHADSKRPQAPKMNQMDPDCVPESRSR